jgi:cytosine/adenosine deaminase-related metal-dependent hydrolase
MLHTVTDPDFDQWISAREGFRMATQGGAISGLMASDLGELAVGRKADIVLLDRQHWSFLPLHDPIAQLAYSAPPDAVRTVLVDGQTVMRDGVIRTVDESFVRDAVIEAAERWRRDVKPLAIAAAETMMPVMAAGYWEAIQAFETEPWAAALRRPRS